MVFAWHTIEAKSVFEARTIKMMELLVLSTLKWRMQVVTACSFIDYFLCKFNDHDTPSMLAFSCSTLLILSTAKWADFLVFRHSEIAGSDALPSFGEHTTSVVKMATTNCKYINTRVFYDAMWQERCWWSASFMECLSEVWTKRHALIGLVKNTC